MAMPSETSRIEAASNTFQPAIRRGINRTQQSRVVQGVSLDPLGSLPSSRLWRLIRRAKALYEVSGSKGEVLRFFKNYGMRKLPLLTDAVIAKLKLRSGLSAGVAPAAGDRPLLLFHTNGGGLGDDIVLARFIRDLIEFCGPLDFDIASNFPDRSAWVFSSVPGFRGCQSPFIFREIAPRYSLSARAGQVVEIGACQDGLDQAQPKLAMVRAKLEQFALANALYIRGLPYTSGDLARRAVYANATRATFLHHQAGIPYSGDRLSLVCKDGAVEQLGLGESKFVTVHNGFDPGFVVSGQTSSKTYRAFEDVIRDIKAALPGLKFVQLGTSDTSTAIPGIDYSLIDRTTLPEVAALIAGSRLHLDVDSGLTHLAAALGTPSVVLFGPSDADYFGYAENTNLRPTFCGGCWWTSEAWMDRCARGFDEPHCMNSHAPSVISDRAIAMLKACEQSPIFKTS